MSVPAWSAILEVQDPDGTRTRHPFRHPRVTVGRRRDNDLTLADEGVSHRHCEFVSEQGFFLVRDLGSHNGTFVNDQRVGEARLRDGDEVRIGGTRIQIALQGKVRTPPSKARWTRVVLPLVLLALAAAGGWRFVERERELRARYLSSLRQHLALDPCAAPQSAELLAVDAQFAGRSLAIGRISRSDEEADRQLLELYRKKLGVYPKLLGALSQSRQEQSESAERIARLGQRFASARDRKLAQWAEGVLQDRARAADDLVQGVRVLGAQTQKLVELIESVVVRHEAARAAELAQFHFGSDLRSLQKTCRDQVDRAAAAAAGALSALAE